MKKNYLILLFFIFSCLAIPTISNYHSQLKMANAANVSCMNIEATSGLPIAKTHTCENDNNALVHVGFEPMGYFWTSITNTTSPAYLLTSLYYYFEYRNSIFTPYSSQSFVALNENIDKNNNRTDIAISKIKFSPSSYGKKHRDYSKNSIARCRLSNGDWCAHETNSQRLI